MAYLKDSEKSDGEGVEVGGWGPVLKVKGSSEELHAKQGKDLNSTIVLNFIGRCAKKNYDTSHNDSRHNSKNTFCRVLQISQRYYAKCRYEVSLCRVSLSQISLCRVSSSQISLCIVIMQCAVRFRAIMLSVVARFWVHNLE